MIKFPKEILNQIQQHLISEKSKVEKQIAELVSQDPFSDTERLSDNAASDTDAKEEFNHDRYQAMQNEMKQKLEAIVAALQRIAKGNYGLCVNCKQLIDTDRLAAVPTAELCMNCESKKRK